MTCVIQNLTRILFAGLLLAIGCSSQQYNPNHWHAGFVSGLNHNVGKNFEQVRMGETGGWAQDKYEISHTILPNGNVAHKFLHTGTCLYTFEVNPKTGGIVAASWEGDKDNCIIVP